MSKIIIPSDEVELKGTTKKLEYWQHANDKSMIDSTKIYPGGIELSSHASRHNRGGADAIDWSNISKYRKASTSISSGASGSPNYVTVLSVETNWYNLLPLLLTYSPSNLGTGEELTLYFNAILDDDSEVTLKEISGITASGSIPISDLDFTVIPDGKKIKSFKVGIESNLTSPSSSCDVTIIALQF